MSMIQQRTALYALGYGALIWLEATLTIRYLGNWIFMPQDMQATAALFALTPLVVYAVGWCFFYMFKTPREERAAAAILICAIGLVGDALVLGWSTTVYPDFDADQQRLFASWVAWAYGTGLLSGLWPSRMPGVPAV